MNIELKTTEILVKNNLNFSIEKAPLFALNGEGNQLITPYYGLINTQTNEVINTCKKGYTISQNADVVGMVLQGMQKFGTQLEVIKAGSINGGRRIFLQLKIDGVAKVGNDYVTKYITVVDSNDGSTGLSIGIGDEQAHCLNQFFKFYKKGEAKFRHTATITQKIATIPQLIEVALNESLRQIELYKKWESTPLTKNLADKLVNEVLGYDRIYTNPADFKELGKRSLDMMDLLYSNINTEIEQVGENLFALFNGVTRFTTHHQKTPTRENGFFESMLSGSGYKKNIAAFDFCEAQ